MSQGWEEIDHTADWSLRVWANDARGLYEAAAQGMVALIGGEADPAGEPIDQRYQLNAPDPETLLVDWLTELLVLVEEQETVLSKIVVTTVDDASLEGQVEGRRGAAFSKHIKAVTYHNLAITKTADGLETTIVFDV